jgi:ABC-type glycerol-3-phosphate transport system substrate-binding protein
MQRRDFLRTSAGALAAGALVGSGALPLEAARQPARSATKTTVKFWWHHGGAIGQSVLKAIKAFEAQNPDIEVQGLQDIDLGTKVATALAGGVGPDVWDSDMGTLGLAARGAIQPLDQFLKNSAIKVADYPQQPAMVWRGSVYAIPAIESGMENGLLWNKALFRAAGLNPEAPPRTWDEITHLALKLTTYDKAGNITQLGFDPFDSSGGMFPNWLTAMGIKFYDAKTNKITYTQPEAIALVEWLVGLVQKLGPAKVGAFHKTYPTWGSVTAGGAFATSKEAMMIDGSWAPGGLRDLAPHIDVGYTWVPTRTGALRTQQMGAHQLAINARSSVAPAAWKLIEFMATTGNDMIYKQSGSFAYTTSFAARANLSPFKGLSWYFNSVHQASFIEPRGYCPVAADAWGDWWNAVDDLVYGHQTSVRAALSKAEGQSQARLARLGHSSGF